VKVIRPLTVFAYDDVPHGLRFADGPDVVHRNQIGRLELEKH
jgi:hypothetical protein